jgi:flavin prenyltransferase
MATFTIGITGASGAIYAKRLMEALLQKGHTLIVTPTEAGRMLLEFELSLKLTEGNEHAELTAFFGTCFSEQIRFYPVNQIGAPIASGSFPVDGMVILPCSMSTMSAIANGSAANLLQRAADVSIKERRNLIIVPRETPLSAIHLKNMLTLAQSGVCVIPACPSFYSMPVTLEDAVDTVVSRIIDQLNVSNDGARRWNGM